MIAQSQKEMTALSSGLLNAKNNLSSGLHQSCHVMSCLTGPGLNGTSSCSTSNTRHGQMGTLVPISDLKHLAGASKIVLVKFLENRLKIDREIGEKHALQVNVTCQIQDGGLPAS